MEKFNDCNLLILVVGRWLFVISRWVLKLKILGIRDWLAQSEVQSPQ